MNRIHRHVVRGCPAAVIMAVTAVCALTVARLVADDDRPSAGNHAGRSSSTSRADQIGSRERLAPDPTTAAAAAGAADRRDADRHRGRDHDGGPDRERRPAIESSTKAAGERGPNGGRPDDPAGAMRFEAIQAGVDRAESRAALRAGVDRVTADVRNGVRRTYPLVAGLPVKPRSDWLRTLDEAAARVLREHTSFAVPTWRALGPEGFGGRSRCLVIGPCADDTPPDRLTLWAGSAGGGVWRSVDGGAHWRPASGFAGNLAVSTLAADPARPGTLYAGTGEGFGNLDAVKGDGVYRTTDGDRWDRLPATAGTEFNYVNRLAVCARGHVLLVATEAGLFRGLLPECRACTQSRLARPDPGLLADAVADVKFAPDDANERNAIAGGRTNGTAYYSMDGGETWGVARHDGQWTGRVELVYALHDSSVVYAAAAVPGSDEKPRSALWLSTDGGHSYRALAALSNGAPLDWLDGAGWYANTLWAYARHRHDGGSESLAGPAAPSGPGATDDPNADNLIIVGGADLWRSVDGGYSFTKISDWTRWADGSPHADHHAIVPVPNFAKGEPPASMPATGPATRPTNHHFQGYVCTDGGIYLAADLFTVGNGERRTKGWLCRNDGFAVAQLYGAAAARVGPDDGRLVLVAGAQDLGTLIARNARDPKAWAILADGDGGFCAADPSSPGHFYTEFDSLRVCRASDDARFVSDITGAAGEWDAAAKAYRPKPAPYFLEDAGGGRSNFIAPFLLDPNNPDRLFAGGLSLWRTNDPRARLTDVTGPTWQVVKDPIAPPDRVQSADHAICAIAVTRGDPDAVWVGHNNGAVYRTQDGTTDRPHWTEVNELANPPLPRERPCNRITVLPGPSANPEPDSGKPAAAPPPSVVYLAFGAYQPDNLWRSTDGGDHWAAVGTGLLPPLPLYAVTVHPDRADYLYLATEGGVYASDDNGATWALTDQSVLMPGNPGPTNCAVRDLFWEGYTLFAVTHARGLYAIDLTPSPLTIQPGRPLARAAANPRVRASSRPSD